MLSQANAECLDEYWVRNLEALGLRLRHGGAVAAASVRDDNTGQ